jgi:outer membrane autotransporter protein
VLFFKLKFLKRRNGMNFNLKKALLMGTAIVAVGSFAATGAKAAEVTTAGATDWGATAADFAGSDADSVTFGGAHTVTIEPGEDVGTTTTNSLEMSIDTRTSVGNIIFDGGAASPAVSTVYGAVGDSSNFGAGNAATITVGDAGNNEGGNVSFLGNVATGTILNVAVGTGTGTVTLGDGTTATTVGATIDLDAGAAGNGDVILNLNGTTVTGAISDTGADNGAGGILINVDADSSLDGNVTLDTVSNVIVDDSTTLNIGATTFNITATGTIVLGNATTAGATLVFDGTGAQAVTGLIDGDADNLSTISITNTGGTVTFNQAIGATNDLGNFTLAAGSTVNTAGALNSQTVTIGSTATLDADGDILGNVANSGTLDISSGAAAVTGDITGTGTLTVSGTAEVVGDVTQATATIADGAILSVSGDDAAAGAAGTVTIGTVTFGNAGSGLTLDADDTGTTTFTGDLTGDAGDGDLTLGGDAAETETIVFVGNVGASGAAIDDITVGNTNAAVHTASISGNVYADELSVGNGDILTLTGDTVSLATIVGSGAGEGSLILGDGTDATAVTVTGAIGAGDVELAGLQVTSGSTLNITDNLTMRSATDGALDIDGTLVVDSAGGVSILNDLAGNMRLDGTLTVNGAAGTLTLGDNMTAIEVGYAGNGATINVGNVISLGDAMTIGDSTGDTATLVYNETAAFDPDATTGLNANGEALTFTADTVTTVRLGSSVNAWETGDVVTFIDGGAGGTDISVALGDGRIVFDTDSLITLTDNASDANTLSATVSYASAASVFASGATGAGAADAVLALGATGGADLQAIRADLISKTGEEAAEFAESLAPTVDAGFVSAGAQAGDLSFSTTNSRIQLARNGGTDTGMVAGEMGEGVGVWGKAFGQLASQDTREGVNGYDADTFGVAVGIDSENLVPGALVGVSFSYANSDVESENANTTDTDVDSYQLSLYGSKDLNDGMYVSGMVGYARNNIDQTRNNVGGTGLTANADFDADQYMAYAEFGKDYAMNGMTLTPKVLANYAHMNFDGYTETGTSGANQTVSTDDMDVLELGLGVTAAWDLDDNMGNSIRPSLTAEYRYDVIGDEVQTTSNFTGGGASFQSEGFDAAQSSFLIGTGVQYDMNDTVTVSADYGYQFKEDYDAHNLSVRAGVKF